MILAQIPPTSQLTQEMLESRKREAMSFLKRRDKKTLKTRRLGIYDDWSIPIAPSPLNRNITYELSLR